MLALKVEGLNKRYDNFQLKDVSFELPKGYIMGFIGLNGAGKTTTLKSILNMVHTDSGSISILGQNFAENELSLKQDIGYAFGGIDFYTKNKIKNVTNVVMRFYKNWNSDIYNFYLNKFKLDPNKKISELSEGMRVKYFLTIALSHHSKIFILDEPTSGLDPAARDDLLELFQELVEDGETSILFSTHITSDLEKCADYITYINDGRIIESDTLDNFIQTYKVLKGSEEQIVTLKDKLIAYKKNSFGFSGLIKSDDYIDISGVISETPSLEDIMIYYSKKEALC